MGRSVLRPLVALVAFAIAWQLASWTASDAACKSGFDECTWTNMQWVAHGVMPVLLIASLCWFAAALLCWLVRTIKAVDTTSA
jgi:hypothetical protein